MELKGGGGIGKICRNSQTKGEGVGGGVSVRIWVNLSGVGIGRIGGVDFAKTI